MTTPDPTTTTPVPAPTPVKTNIPTLSLGTPAALANHALHLTDIKAAAAAILAAGVSDVGQAAQVVADHAKADALLALTYVETHRAVWWVLIGSLVSFVSGIVFGSHL